MFCNKCGKEVPEGSAFCNFCGAEVPASVRRTTPDIKEQPEEDAPPVQKKPKKTATAANQKKAEAPENPPAKPGETDGEKAKTKKWVLIISIAASVVLIGIILIGTLLLKQPNRSETDDSNFSFQVSRQDSDTMDQSANSAEESANEGESLVQTAAKGVQRIIIWNNAIEGLTASDQPRYKGDLRSAYSIREVYEKCDIQGNDDITVEIIGSDGFIAEEPLRDILKKYLTLEGDDEPVVVGESQNPDLTVWEIAYIIFDTDAIMISYKDKINVADVFEAIGMVKADSYDFICTDGYTYTVAVEDIGDCYISWIEDRVDAEIPGIDDSTLFSILYIQPSA